MSKVKNFIVSFGAFEKIYEAIENDEYLDFEEVPGSESEEGTEQEETMPSRQSHMNRMEMESEPKRGRMEITDPGFSRDAKDIHQIAGDLETAAHTDDEVLAKKALTNWFNLTNSVHGNIAKLGIDSHTIDKLVKAVKAIPNHNELIQSIRSSEHEG